MTTGQFHSHTGLQGAQATEPLNRMPGGSLRKQSELCAKLGHFMRGDPTLGIIGAPLLALLRVVLFN